MDMHLQFMFLLLIYDLWRQNCVNTPPHRRPVDPPHAKGQLEALTPLWQDGSRPANFNPLSFAWIGLNGGKTLDWTRLGIKKINENGNDF